MILAIYVVFLNVLMYLVVMYCVAMDNFRSRTKQDYIIVLIAQVLINLVYYGAAMLSLEIYSWLR